jgi:hypothetical protein
MPEIKRKITLHLGLFQLELGASECGIHFSLTEEADGSEVHTETLGWEEFWWVAGEHGKLGPSSYELVRLKAEDRRRSEQ